MNLQFELLGDTPLKLWRDNPLFPSKVYIKHGALTAVSRNHIVTYCEQTWGSRGVAWDKQGICFYFRTESDAVQFLLAWS